MATLDQLRKQAEAYYNQKANEYRKMLDPGKGGTARLGSQLYVSPSDIESYISSTGGNPYATAYERAKSRQQRGGGQKNPFQSIGTKPHTGNAYQVGGVPGPQSRTDKDRIERLKQLYEMEQAYYQNQPQQSQAVPGDNGFSKLGVGGLQQLQQTGQTPQQRPMVQYQPGPNDSQLQQSREQQRAQQLQSQLNQEYADKLDEANAANEERYEQLVTGATDLHSRALEKVNTLGQQQLGDIDETYRKQGQSNYQGLAARGLTGTTVLPAVQQVLAQEKSDSQRRAQEDITGRQVNADVSLTNNLLGIMERRNDVQPDLNQLIGLQQSMGAGGNGALGYGSAMGGGMVGDKYADPNQQNYLNPNVNQQQQAFQQPRPGFQGGGPNGGFMGSAPSQGGGPMWQPGIPTQNPFGQGQGGYQPGGIKGGTFGYLGPQQGGNTSGYLGPQQGGYTGYPHLPPGYGQGQMLPPNFLQGMMPGQMAGGNRPQQQGAQGSPFRPSPDQPYPNQGSPYSSNPQMQGRVGPMYLSALQKEAQSLQNPTSGRAPRLPGNRTPSSTQINSNARENWKPSDGTGSSQGYPSWQPSGIGGGLQGGGANRLAQSLQSAYANPFGSALFSGGRPGGAGRGGGTGYQYNSDRFGREQQQAPPPATEEQNQQAQWQASRAGVIPGGGIGGGLGGIGGFMGNLALQNAPQLQGQLAGASVLSQFNPMLALLGR